MTGKTIVLTIGAIAMCAGAAAAAPTIARADTPPQRVDPAFVTPVYFVDGVWVEGETIPYRASENRDYPGRQLVWDGGYAVDGGASNWVPGADPCSGYGYFFTSSTNAADPNYFSVQGGHMVNDYDNLDPVAVNKRLSGFFWEWHQFGTENALRIRMRWYDNCNTSNSTTFTGTGFFAPAIPTVAGGGRMGVDFTYGSIPAGNWYSAFDQDPPLFPAGQEFLDRNGAFEIIAESVANVVTRDVSFYLQQPSGTATRPGTSNALAWMDDSGELGRVSATHPYNIAAAVPNNAFQITGTAATGNESYNIPANCNASGLGPSSSWWVKACQTQQAATLNSPANGASGVTNPVTLSFTPPSVLPVDFNANIKLAGHNIHVMANQNVADIPLDISLDAGRAYGWSITSNGGGTCPGTESEVWSFRMAGCPADFNLDTVVDFFDYLDFVSAMSGNQDLADFNADQVIDFFDYLDFVQAFSSSC